MHVYFFSCHFIKRNPCETQCTHFDSLLVRGSIETLRRAFFWKKNCFLWILALTNIIIQETSFLFWYLETMSPHFSKYHKNGYEKFSKYLTAFIQYINMPLHSISILKATHTYRNKTYKVYLQFCWWVIDVTVLYIVKKNL